MARVSRRPALPRKGQIHRRQSHRRLLQAALIDNIDARWKAGAGARLIAPTGDAALGSGKWQIMPIAGVRCALPEISSGSYFEPLLRYDVSFAGDPTRKFISNLQVAPMLNISLPAGWFFTLYPNPEIRWNFGAPIAGQTDARSCRSTRE
jgi:hypothetical protein